MPIGRHFEIVYLLLNKKTMTAGELARHFEVSTRTIYRDIDTLSAAGIPVYSSKGKGGGISLMEGYVFNSSLLSSQEQVDILTALQSLTAARVPETDEVLAKLGRLFKKEINNWIEVDFSPWGGEETQKQLFPLLRRAIAAHLVISFRYYSSSGKQSVRCVEPLQLLFKNKYWYLIGYCRKSLDYRVFKISRMRDFALAEQTFEPKAAPQIAVEDNIMQNAVKATLTISAAGAYRVYDEFSEDQIAAGEDGSFRVTAELPSGEWLYGYLLSFGTLLEGVGPEDLRQSLIAHLEKINSRLKPG